jgi:superfamily I DNA/RNA helicase
VQSVFDGPPPRIGVYPTAEAENEAVAAWIAETISDGVRPEEIGVLVRTVEEFDCAQRAIEAACQRGRTLVQGLLSAPGEVTLATMHASKGLEFLAVAVMACDMGLLPLESWLLAASDESALEEVYTTERHLLYVACTRARDKLSVSGRSPASEFLDDLFDARTPTRGKA